MMFALLCLSVFPSLHVAGAPPPQPHIPAQFFTTNVFWPGESDSNGTVYACTLIPTLVMANNTRLIAHGSCGVRPQSCNGYHLDSPRPGKLSTPRPGNPIFEGRLCQKHSDDGGRTWSRIRQVAGHGLDKQGVETGQVLWDTAKQVLILHTATVSDVEPFAGQVLERRSYDLGATWSKASDVASKMKMGGLKGSITWMGASAGAALQLSRKSKHPNRLIFTGYVQIGSVRGNTFWYSDDGGESYALARNSSGDALIVPGLVETALAETLQGGVTTSSRNIMFHGPGKCDCRATMHSADGGATWGPVGYDAVLVEPMAMATMINVEPSGTIFHANPGHGTDTEIKTPPNGRASGTVRRSQDGGRTWEASVVLNGHDAYSYSCLSRAPQKGFIGLVWETVLPSSGAPTNWSAYNIVFTLIPQNFSANVSRDLGLII